jgi:replicative DNA helicase
MTAERIEDAIFSSLLYNEQYGRKVMPFIQGDYFTERNDKILFDLINNYVTSYNKFPSKEAIIIELLNIKNLNEDDYKSLKTYVKNFKDMKYEESWLLEKTEVFCKDKALYNALMKAIKIVDDSNNKSDKLSVGAIPSILSEALGVSFDTSIGHDFLEDIEQRYEFYHLVENKIKFDLDFMNKITKGGVSRKTLNIAMAGTGAGKSLFMCHCAANNLKDGLNVLYITLEMAEERIAERIDANLLDIPLDELKQLPKESYLKRLGKIKKKTDGKLVIKEYPTASASSGNFRYLINELALKKKFKPDVIYIDYLNICSSARIKQGAAVNSYTYIKAIAEEIRGLAIEFNVPIFSATQTTRGGYDNSDVSLTDTSESFGLPATADFMFALIATEQLDSLNQLMIKQLKNRYGDLNYLKRFVVGIDRSKMKLYDVEESAQADIIDDKMKRDQTDDEPIMDKTTFGNRSMDDPEYRRNKMKELR